jgi:hypothetical protein
MGDLAISALTDANTQLRQIIPGLSKEQAFAMLGATPMIGVNDTTSEVFGVDDVNNLVGFARANKLGLLSFWGINRDQPCPSGPDLVLCSEVNSFKFQFEKAFSAILQ